MEAMYGHLTLAEKVESHSKFSADAMRSTYYILGALCT